MAAISYVVPSIEDGQTYVTVKFVDEDGNFTFKDVNIPRNSDGSLDSDEWSLRLEQQTRGVQRKVDLGVVTLEDSDAYVPAPEISYPLPHPPGDFDPSDEGNPS